MTGGEIRLEGLEKQFGDVVAVDGIDLDIPGGEFFTMLGPSGCGKTTTLRMIGGFERPDEGRIMLDGDDVSQVPPHLRNVNTVFQSYALFTHMDVRDNVAFGLRYKGIKGADAQARVDKAMELVQLEGLGDRRTSQLSGGQQQRVALARALVLEAPVLLLDEPLGALDARLRLDLQVELKRIQERLGITFVYVTHDQDEAMTMSQRVAVMRGGSIEQCDTPRTLYEEPATAFVANFLGSANLLRAQVEADGNGCLVNLDGYRLRSDSRPPAPGSAYAMIRPEYVRLEAQGSGGENRIPGIVQEVVYLGFHQDVRVRLASGELLRSNVPNDGEAPEYAQGDSVDVHLQARHLRVLPDDDDLKAGIPGEADEAPAAAGDEADAK